MLEADAAGRLGPAPPGLGTADASPELLDAAVRMLRLLDRPGDRDILAPMIKRELLWRLLDGLGVPEAARVVAAAALRRPPGAGHDVVATGHPRRPGLTRLTEDARDVHPLGVEQSNSSVLVGGG